VATIAGKDDSLSGKLKRSKFRRTAILLFIGTWTVLLLLVAVSVLFLLGIKWQHVSFKTHPGETLKNGDRLPSDAIPPFEIFPEDEALEKEGVPFPEVHTPDRIPKVAIIIDDLGYDRQQAQAFIDLGVALTLSVLPHSPFQKEIVRSASLTGNEIILHLPMEPGEYPKIDPGPGALLMDMTPEAFVQQLFADLEAIPSIKGVNNHMGSRITSDRDLMTILFSIRKERGLFFIDSRTTPRSVAGDIARAENLDFAQRDVFLDHVPKTAFVEKQIDRLLEYARRKGTAIGIAHPNKATYRVLQARLPQIVEGVTLVPVSSVLYQRQAEDNGIKMPVSTLPMPRPDPGPISP